MKTRPLRPKVTVRLANGLLRVLEWNDSWNVAFDAAQRMGDVMLSERSPVRAKDYKCIGNQSASGSEPTRSVPDHLTLEAFGPSVRPNSSTTK